MTDITAWLDAAQKRCDEAADGPWEANGSDVIRVVPDTNGDPEPELVAQTWRVDAEFIANARTDLPAALAALRAVLGEHTPGEFRPEPGEGLVSTPDDEPVSGCLGCEAPYYPCPTVRAIATALGTTP